MERHRRRVWRWVSAGLVAVVLLVVLSRLRPAAPRRVDLLTGPEGSAYEDLGRRFADVLRDRGIDARVVVTPGALANLERLAASDSPAVAFAQTGVERELDDPSAAEALVSLGSLGYEPIWVFARDASGIRNIGDLPGHKVALGPKGSGSRALADLIIEVNEIGGKIEHAAFDAYTPDDLIEALGSGDIDAAFFSSSPTSPRLKRLLGLEGVSALALRRATAYAARYPEFARLVIPMGGIDLARNLPDEDLELVAGATNLVARKDLHPAAVGVFLDAARTVGRRSDLAAPAGTFPSTKHTSLPLSEDAEHYLEQGPTGFARVLPYWAAAIADQLVFVVLPALLGLLAVLKSVPTLLNVRFAIRSTKLYRRLAIVEQRASEPDAKADLLAELSRIDEESRALKPTLSKLAPYFELRQNLHDVRDRVEDTELG